MYLCNVCMYVWFVFGLVWFGMVWYGTYVRVRTYVRTYTHTPDMRTDMDGKSQSQKSCTWFEQIWAVPSGTPKVIAGDSWGRIAVPMIELYPATAIIFCGWAKSGGPRARVGSENDWKWGINSSNLNFMGKVLINHEILGHRFLRQTQMLLRQTQWQMTLEHDFGPSLILHNLMCKS